MTDPVLGSTEGEALMGVYLEDHPPARRQFRNPRRAQPTGAICIHTAENATDVNPPDTGAEAVARFIATRDTPGSYHTVVDSDSTVRVGRYEWEMFHEGTGGNRWSLGLSFACKAHQWPTLPADWVTATIDRGALEAAQMAAWVKTTVGVTIPARRITAAQYRNGAPGFISHADLDPGRRSDPGPRFPWGDFLDRFARYTTQERPPPMSITLPASRDATIKRIQAALGVVVDGDPYVATAAAAEALAARARELEAQVAAADPAMAALGRRFVALVEEANDA